MNLKQSPLSQIEPVAELTATGWQLPFDASRAPASSCQLLCERVAGQTLSAPAQLDMVQHGNTVSFDALAKATGVAVDEYAHPVFSLVDQQADQGASLRIAARPLPMSATANFRDYGGHINRDGRQVVWGKLFRTGHMGEMSERDRQAIQQLNITAVCDFRRAEEAANQPSQLPEGLEPTSIVISPGSSIDLFSAIMEEGVKEQTIDAFMQEINRDLARSHQASYRRMFDELLAHGERGSIIHCSAGKDRTGFGGLLVLGALGVDQQTILNDYLLTNQYVNIDREIARWENNYRNSGWSDERSAEGGFNRDALGIILRVKASYLQAAMDTIEESFGGIERYLSEQIGLTEQERKALEAFYLY